MTNHQTKTGLANINHAQIYYEVAGKGIPLVMIHAGVADSRQWDNEFKSFANAYRVIRYDLRGYGKSEPVAGDFNHLHDLISLLETLDVREPFFVMGCSMGGGLAMDFALLHPARVRALIMVGSGPSGLKLEVPPLAKFAEVEKAFDAGELDLVCELEIQIWFDGTGRTPAQVNQPMRKLAYEMNRQALAHEAKQLGKRLPNTDLLTAERLTELANPVLIIIGAHDTPYILAATEYMIAKLPTAQKIIMDDAAHLPNMEHPASFQKIVSEFLNRLT